MTKSPKGTSGTDEKLKPTSRKLKKTLKEYIAEQESKANKQVELPKLLELFEHKVYKQIPGTKNSYRPDSGDTNTLTQDHAHVFAKPEGKGKQLYAVNYDGSGHDGSSGAQISKTHADYFRSIGYDIKPDNILESINVTELSEGSYSIIVLEDA